MVIRFTDTNAPWLAPKGTGTVVLLMPPETPPEALAHFLGFTHAFRLATFDRERRVPTGILDTARYPSAVQHLLGPNYAVPAQPTAVVVKNRKILGQVAFDRPAAAATSLAQVAAKKLSTRAIAPTPVDQLAGAHVELMSRVFHKNASVALFYGKNAAARQRAQEECEAWPNPDPGFYPGFYPDPHRGRASRRGHRARSTEWISQT